ncbi:glycosyltransferase family 2 protein [Peptoniphilus sp. KCTC 25270]|uniref:glycosyltransferase n=1 Tax=Peptoniphilus sp. KCTC 25270 TaxID=2897414 RepID=UPI001E3EF300|nr:glycosyltransferase family 2 protein [Peptoniphilus sp. KCTC 25270]MCD1147304.1 glycosyltransferase family 2 protein [Peptoniphilus sp. KCTC 25270]
MFCIPILIPAYEPDSRLFDLISELHRRNMGPIYIVNDGSSSSFDSIFSLCQPMVQDLGGKILIHPENRGKGQALKTAIAAVSEDFPEILGVVTADSDGQHDPDSIEKIRKEMEKNPGDLILGFREFSGEEVPLRSRLGNAITEKVFQFVTGRALKDTQTGLRGIPREMFSTLLSSQATGFEFEMEMLVDGIRSFEIVEIPIETIYDSREHHQSHFHTVKDSWKVYRVLGRGFFLFACGSVLSMALDLFLFSLFCSFFKSSYPGIYIVLATILARVCSSFFNLVFNYKIVFQSSQNFLSSLGKYYSLALFIMGASAIFVSIILWIFPSFSEVVVKFFVDLALFFVSYSIQNKRVFRKK